VFLSGSRRGVGAALKKRLKRRSAMEPVIGHMKSDGRMAHYFLQRVQADAVNVLLCAAAYNLRKILAKLRLFCAPMRSAFYALLRPRRVFI
jgi:transposase, IS5 family